MFEGGEKTVVWRRTGLHVASVLLGYTAAEPSFLPGVSRCVSFLKSCLRRMVLSTSQQVALAFTAVLLMFVVLPRLFGVSGGGTVKENTFDPRYSRKGNLIFIAAKAKKLSVIQCSSAPVYVLHHQQCIRKVLAVKFVQFLVFRDHRKDNIRLMPHPMVYYWF